MGKDKTGVIKNIGVGGATGAVVSMVVLAIIQSGLFTTPGDVKTEVQQMKAELKEDLKNEINSVQKDLQKNYIPRSELDARLSAISQSQRDIKEMIWDLYNRDTINGGPVPRGYVLTPSPRFKKKFGDADE